MECSCTEHPSTVPGREPHVILEDRLLGEFNDFLLVDQQYLKSYVLEYAFRHNYTMNREAIAEAIEDRYTYWPDASDENAIRKHFIHVCLVCSSSYLSEYFVWTSRIKCCRIFRD
ncbi:unnamed protein product [Gongylonema pulchrum]|uniref:LisH domain-containing protein n=1 Tax=Gongylonema pulchrum TaxID=637853 RepID=A0A183ETB7_9BILA|nr:unnamed protein product [Gongylonema pulchrum]